MLEFREVYGVDVKNAVGLAVSVGIGVTVEVGVGVDGMDVYVAGTVNVNGRTVCVNGWVRLGAAV